MKTYKHLYEQITSFENLRIAFKKAAKGKRSKNDVAGFEFNAAVFPVSTGIPFLGWRVYPSYRRLKRRNGVAFQRRFTQMRRDLAAGRLSRDKLHQSIQSWIAHVSHGKTWGLRRSLLSHPLRPSATSPKCATEQLLATETSSRAFGGGQEGAA